MGVSSGDAGSTGCMLYVMVPDPTTAGDFQDSVLDVVVKRNVCEGWRGLRSR